MGIRLNQMLFIA